MIHNASQHHQSLTLRIEEWFKGSKHRITIQNNVVLEQHTYEDGSIVPDQGPHIPFFSYTMTTDNDLLSAVEKMQSLGMGDALVRVLEWDDNFIRTSYDTPFDTIANAAEGHPADARVVITLNKDTSPHVEYAHEIRLSGLPVGLDKISDADNIFMRLEDARDYFYIQRIKKAPLRSFTFIEMTRELGLMDMKYDAATIDVLLAYSPIQILATDRDYIHTTIQYMLER